MLSQLPAFASLVLAEPMAYTLTLLLVYILILNIRRSVHTGLRYYDEDS